MNNEKPAKPHDDQYRHNRWRAGQRVALRSGAVAELRGVLVTRNGHHRWIVRVECLQAGVFLAVDEEALTAAAEASKAIPPPADLVRRAVMNYAKSGDRVRVECTEGPEGIARDKPTRRRLFEFTVGSNEMLPGISVGVVGMVVGETKRLVLQPQDAYGVVRSGLIREVSRKKFHQHLDLFVGKRLVSQNRAGQRRRITVVQVHRNSVLVDENHPLAGKVLNVQIRLISLHQSRANTDKPFADLGGEG